MLAQVLDEDALLEVVDHHVEFGRVRRASYHHQARPDAKHASHADAGETTRTILASERLADVVTKLYRYGVDRLYVVDEECILLGVVLAVDIIRLVVQVQCAPLEDAAGDIARD